MKRYCMWLLVAALLLTLSACRQNPAEDQLFSKLIAHFEERGYPCTLSRLADSQPERDVPIYKASAWHRLTAGEEEMLVYFDESNRADYLSEPIDESIYGHVSRYGLRFVVVYPGEDAGILEALESMPE